MVKRPKIALCFPNFGWQHTEQMYMWHMVPYALCLLAAKVRDFCDVDIIDANKEALSESEFADRIARGAYDLVGVSVLMDTFAATGHRAVALARQACPAAVTVMGGVYPTMSPEHAIRNPDLDYVCIGEAEESFPALVRHLFLSGNMPEQGFAYRKDGQTVMQPRAPFVEDLDSQPLPAYDLIDYPSYANSYTRKTVDGPPLLPHAEIMSSRGCPQKCSFCQAAHILGRRIRARSAENVLGEIEWLKTEYGIRSFNFVDDNFIAVRRRIDAILRGLLERKLAMPWKSIATAVFCLDEKLLALMAESGCRYICVAIESGSPRVLKEIIDKPVNLGHAKKMIAFAQSLGIYVSANFIIGFPGETWEEIRQTLRTAEELGSDYVKIFSAIPLQHTRLWDLCEREKAFAPGFDPYDISWNQGQIVSPHFDDRELTLLRAYEWDRINFSTPERLRATADMMGIEVAEMNGIRRETRNAALAKLSAHTA